MITLFSAPKPFLDEHIARIQRNAVESWLALGNQVEVLLVGDEPGLAEFADELGITLLPVSSRAPSGAPLLDEIFRRAGRAAANPIMGYLNADIILMDDFIPCVELVAASFDEFLVVGNRVDVEIRERLSFQAGWARQFRKTIADQGRLHPPMGSDYFVFRRGQYEAIPAFALGRAGWDNWMIYKARHESVPVIDASEAVTVVHQNHDYGHLPGGEPHYRHPESTRNIELAGGYEMMFRLRDADWIISPEGIRKKWAKDWQPIRRIEADLISYFGSGLTSKTIHMLFHPSNAFSYLRYKLLGPDGDNASGPSNSGASR